VKWIIGLQKYELDINLVHTIKDHGLYRLAVQEEEEELTGWKQEMKMYDVEKAPPTACRNSWYQDVCK